MPKQVDEISIKLKAQIKPEYLEQLQSLMHGLLESIRGVCNAIELVQDEE